MTNCFCSARAPYATCRLSGLTAKRSGSNSEKSIWIRRFSVTSRRGGLSSVATTMAQHRSARLIKSARRVGDVVMRLSSVCAWLYLERRCPGGDRDFNHRRLPGRERLLQGPVETFWLSCDALRAKHARHFGKAGVVQGGADLSPMKTRALVVLRRAQGIINEHHYHHANTIVHGSSEFGQRVHEAAIAGDGHDRALWQR